MTLTTAQLEQLTEGQDAARKRGMTAERIQMLDEMVTRGVKAAETFRSYTQERNQAQLFDLNNFVSFRSGIQVPPNTELKLKIDTNPASTGDMLYVTVSGFVY